jgi:hypothetical protein
MGESYARSGVWYSNVNCLHYTSAGIIGAQFPQNPGSDTWAFKTLPGVAVSTMLEAEYQAAQTKHANTYTQVQGLNITFSGITASGEYYDTTRFIDWISAIIQVDVFALVASLPKVPYTDLGVDMIKNSIAADLARGVKVGGFAATPAPTVSAPLVATVSTIDKAARLLPDVTFTATLAGAIHKAQITGVVSV